MVCPEPPSRDLPSHVGGHLGRDQVPECGQGIRPWVGSHTRFGKASDPQWTTANQIERSLLFLFLSVFLVSLWPSPPVERVPSQMALECRLKFNRMRQPSNEYQRYLLSSLSEE